MNQNLEKSKHKNSIENFNDLSAINEANNVQIKNKKKLKFNLTCLICLIVAVGLIALITGLIVLIVLLTAKSDQKSNLNTTSLLTTTTTSKYSIKLNTTFSTKLQNTSSVVDKNLTEINLTRNLCGFYQRNEKYSKCYYGYNGIYCDECGLNFRKPNVKIVGGMEAIPNSWPSIVLIVFRYKFLFNIAGVYYEQKKSASCGGTLINRDTVLTAAHCFVSEVTYSYGFFESTYKVEPNSFYPTYESMYTVYLGMHNVKSAYEGGDVTPGIAVPINKFTIHSKYNPYTNQNDIGVIKLNYQVNFDCNIQPACLPNPSIANYPIVNNVNVLAVGWGSKQQDGALPFELNNVKMTLYDNSKCSDVSPFTYKDWTKQLCAGEYAGGKDTCQGDSGGPLYMKDYVNGIEKYVLIGITSYGDGCGIAGLPGVYTKVSSYLKWIEENS